MSMLHVFGHKNPDTDSTVSAIAYAWYRSSTGTDATAFVLGEPNREAAYVLDRFDFPVPAILANLEEGADVVIVDTNNPSELPDAIGSASIKEIIDHHKLGGLVTPDQLTVTIRPVACTSTILYGIMKEAGVDVPEKVAAIMLSAILSDTLKFTSPTTTDEDREAGAELARIAGVEVEELASAMFAAKSDLAGMDAKGILLSDSKLFDMGGKKIRVSSLETVLPAKALELEANLLAGAEALKEEEGLDGLFFFIVDILKGNSVLLLASQFEKDVAAKAFEKEASGSSLDLPGVVSRKKQMVPPLEKALS